MIADILTAAAVELRRLLAEEDRFVQQQVRLGATVHADDAVRAHIDRVVTDMETLAKRLLSVGPFVEMRR
jgi:hypothetical protein